MAAEAKSKIPVSKIFIGYAIAAVIAIISNVIIWAVGRAVAGETFLAPLPPDNEFLPMPIFPVIIATAVFLLLGTIVFLILSRVQANPSRTWLIIAVVAWLLSYLLIFNAPGGPLPTTTMVLFGIMHLVAAIPITYRFYTLQPE